MQGIYERPKTKKALKEAVAQGSAVTLEATSVFGNEYDGSIYNAPNGRYYVVGPDPYTKRSWYATILVTDGKAKVS